VNIAERAAELIQEPEMKRLIDLPIMAEAAQRILKDSLDAFVNSDAEMAERVIRDDNFIDDCYEQIFRELLTYMMEDPRNISACTHLLFMAKNIERIGDHATNIAEDVYYLVHGTPLTEARPKGDQSNLEIVNPARRTE
jgi:phosphate transport system protein